MLCKMNFFSLYKSKRFRLLSKYFVSFRSTFFKITGPYGEAGLFLPSYFIGLVPFEPSSNKGGFKRGLQRLFSFLKGLYSPFWYRLNIFGTGYKAYCPKSFNRGTYVFRVGYGAVELARNLRQGVKARARKQKLLITSPFFDLLANEVSDILHLKRPDAYKAKGLRLVGANYPLKPGKVRANR